jgi:hypothetical protein
MSNLNKRQSLVQDKRKQTDFRDFLKEIASRCPINLYKIDGKISRYPQTERVGKLVSSTQFMEETDSGASGP